MDIDLKVTHKIIKLLGKNIGITFHNLGLGKALLDVIPNL